MIDDGSLTEWGKTKESARKKEEKRGKKTGARRAKDRRGMRSSIGVFVMRSSFYR